MPKSKKVAKKPVKKPTKKPPTKRVAKSSAKRPGKHPNKRPTKTELTEGGRLLLEYLASRKRPMTKRAFAEKLDVSTAYISMLTTGKTTPSLAVSVQIQKIAKKVKPETWTVPAKQ
jgi:plasmid maintenance system antidote protein VapI